MGIGLQNDRGGDKIRIGVILLESMSYILSSDILPCSVNVYNITQTQEINTDKLLHQVSDRDIVLIVQDSDNSNHVCIIEEILHKNGIDCVKILTNRRGLSNCKRSYGHL